MVKTRDKLAIHGGRPVRTDFLPYGRQWVDEGDCDAVLAVLRSDWLTTGPKISEFEDTFARVVGAKEAVVFNNGTTALHAAMYGAGVGPGDEVIVPAMTFVATANAAVFQGATPVIVDVDPQTLVIDPEAVKRKLTPRTRAIVTVDFAGHPCDYDTLRTVANDHGVWLIADACHALGATYRTRPVGSLADLTVFSFHPVKHITTGEGGMVTVDDAGLASRMRRFRNHGISRDHHQRHEASSWFYEAEDLGYNYRITDFQCALGLSQLRRLPQFISSRRRIARRYDEALASLPGMRPLRSSPEVEHAYHLYIVECDPRRLRADRDALFAALRAEGIGVNVHYIPVHLHPFYRRQFGTGEGLCPNAERAFERILTLPLFPKMTEMDVEDVVRAILKVVEYYAV